MERMSSIFSFSFHAKAPHQTHYQLLDLIALLTNIHIYSSAIQIKLHKKDNQDYRKGPLSVRLQTDEQAKPPHPSRQNILIEQNIFL